MRMSASLLFALLSACLTAPQDAAAHPAGPRALYSVSVHSESGRELPTFHHGGQTFVLGQYGERYDIRVQNRSGRRVEAVVTVDGRDVVSGRVGDFVSERGYLIDAYDDVTISGFRQSVDAVAAFRFSSPGESYSARMGTPQNVGVIGVAIFPERAHRPIARPLYQRRRAPERRYDSYGDPPGGARDEAASHRVERKKSGRGVGPTAEAPRASAPSASGAMEREGYAASSPAPSTDNLGTEYGERLDNSVQEVHFQRANRQHPAEIMTLRYDDRDGLVARGILVDPVRAPRASAPQAFPHNRFAPPPPPHGGYDPNDF